VIEAEPAQTAYLRGRARDLRRLVDWEDGSMLVARPRASSDTAGAFRLGPLSPAPQALRASHAAFVSSELVVAPGGSRVTLVLRRGAALLGRAIGPGGRPAGARVTVARVATPEVHRLFDWTGNDREPAPEARREVRSATDGRFRIDGLGAGTYELKIEAPELATLSREVEVAEVEKDLGDFELEAPLEIAGHVLKPDRHGAEGARVRAGRARHALHAGNTIAPESPPAIVETESDVEGRFVLRGIPSGEFQVEAEADGFARALAPSVAAGEGSLELVLEEGFTVHGKVVDAERLKPVAGAEVELLLASRRKALSDAEGVFVIRGFPRAEGRYGADLRVTHPEYGLYWAHAVTILGRTTRSPLEVRLGRGGQEIRGRVHDKTGQPIANAQVWIEPAGESSSYSTPGDRTMSRADGLFRLPEPAWLRYNMERPEVTLEAFHAAHAAGRAGPFLVPATGEPWLEVAIELGEAASLEGIVTGRDGLPVAGARVTARPPSGGGRERKLGGILGARSIFTRKDGRYRLHCIEVGEIEVVAEALEYAPARVSMMLEPGVTRQDLALDVGSPIRGRVVAAGGSPLEGVDVTAVAEGAVPPEAGSAFGRRMELRGRVGIAVATTDTDGRYELSHLAEGSYAVIARASGYEAVDAKGIRAGESARDIVLERFSALRGSVVDPDGEPVTAFKVDAIDKARRAEQEERADWRVGSQGEVSFQDSQGRFLYDGLRPGEYDIVVSAPGFLAFRGETRLDAGEEAAIEARLSKGCRLDGAVRDAVTGRPVTDALVTCTRQMPRAELEALLKRKGAVRAPMPPPSGSGNTWSADEGTWTIDGLVDGEYVVWAEHPFYLRGSARAELSPGGTGRVELRLEPTGRLEGTVAGLGGSEPAGPGIELHHAVEVELVGASEEDSKRARANGEWSFPVDRPGHFQAQGLRPGLYRLSLKSRPYRRGKFEETGPGWGNSRLEPAGPERVAQLGEVEVRTGETATFNGKVSR
jgi:protocatechuate 3,4-dioxygenase beta subunit